MKKLLILVIALLLFSSTAQTMPITNRSDPALSGASVINFNEIAIGQRFYKIVNINEVTFRSTASGTQIADSMRIWDYNAENPATPLNWIEGQSMEIHFNVNPIISFSEETDVLAFDVSFLNGPWTLEVYDINDILLETLQIPDSPTGFPTGWEFYGINHSGISYAKVISDGQDNVMIDNLYYTTSNIEPVPEPTTIALLGIGLSGLAGVALRRRFKRGRKQEL